MQPIDTTTLLSRVPFDLLLWGIIGLTLIVFGVYSAIMLWHWNEYGTGKYTTAANMTLYLVTSFTLLGLMVGSALWYSAI